MMIRSTALRLLNNPAPQQALLAARHSTTSENVKDTLKGLRQAVQDATMQTGDIPEFPSGKPKDTIRGTAEADAKRGPEGAQGETPMEQSARQAAEQTQQTWDSAKASGGEGMRRAQETWDETKERSSETLDSAKGKADEMREGASKRMDETTHQAQDMAHKAKEKVHQGWEKAKENVSQTVEKVKHAFGAPSGGPDEPSGPK